MRWKTGRRSSNVEDLRGRRTGGRMSRGRRGGFGIPMSTGAGKRRGGCSLTPILVMLFLAYVFGFNPLSLLTGGINGGTGSGQVAYPQQTNPQSYQRDTQRGGQSGSAINYPGTSSRQARQPSSRTSTSVARDEMSDFISAIKGYNEDVWSELLGRSYRPAKLKIFDGAIRTACGVGKSAMGPFYCPGDEQIYIDPSFFIELSRRHKAPGDFAQAFVIAHEVGHHIQNITGIADQVRRQQRRSSKKEKNKLSVMQELNADCLAGVWANRAHKKYNLLEAGDVEEGITAALAIGDDRLQKQAQGFAIPHTFTHGSSKQRAYWLKVGLNTGDFTACDTFSQ